MGAMAGPLLTDELWDHVAPLLPPLPPQPKGGRPPVPHRAALGINNLFHLCRHRVPAAQYRAARTEACQIWAEVTGVTAAA